MKTYRVGIIGFGLMGKVNAYAYNNLRFYYDLPFDVETYGVCDQSPEILEKAKRHRFSFFTDDPMKLIAHPDIDFIDIASPNQYHLEQISAAFQAGKQVYCQKPVVSDMEEARSLEKLLASNRGTYGMAFNSRFFPATLQAKTLIDSGFLGIPINFRIYYYHSGSLDKNKPMGWKQGKGAGVLLDLGSHVLDLASFLLSEYESVLGRNRILYPERKDKAGKTVKVEVEDYCVTMARMKNGCTGVIEASKIAAGAEDEISIEVYGSEGALRFNSMSPNFLHICDLRTKEKGFQAVAAIKYPEGLHFPGPKFGLGWVRTHIHSVYSFVKAAGENRPADPSFTDGIYNMRVAEAIARSWTSGTWEKIS